jgi:D-glycero-alpha-D-manno-heptose 1-phosphate guanylyltransferase
MEAIVLAGGFGTRLQSVISEVPKPMAPVNEKPFLKFILKYLQKNGVTRVVLSVGYKWEIIERYFGNRFDKMELVYSVEDELLGTGGAIKKALSLVKSNNVFIINGDTFFNIKLSSLSLKENSLLQLSLKKMYNFNRYGSVKVDESGRVVNFDEKSFKKEGNINGGVYLLNTKIFENFNLPLKFSFEEFMEKNYNTLNISAKVFKDYFVDIGIPEDYEKAQNEIKKYI